MFCYMFNLNSSYCNDLIGNSLFWAFHPLPAISVSLSPFPSLVISLWSADYSCCAQATGENIGFSLGRSKNQVALETQQRVK